MKLSEIEDRHRAEKIGACIQRLEKLESMDAHDTSVCREAVLLVRRLLAVWPEEMGRAMAAFFAQREN